MDTPDHRPPKWADRFLQWYCHPDFIEEIQGDLYESYYKRSESSGYLIARIFFVTDVFRSLSIKTIQFPSYSITDVAMVKNNFILFFRKLNRRKAFAAINATGLSVSLAATLLIYLYVSNELSFDRFNSNADRVYRIYCAYANPGESVEEFPATPPNFAPAVKGEITDVEHVVRIFDETNIIVKAGDKSFSETQYFTVDSAFFSIFTGHFLAGDPVTALASPHSAVITKSSAERYFGSAASALNKDIVVNTLKVYNITGVVEDFPPNSHFRFHGLLSLDYTNENLNPDNWLAHWPATYLLLHQDRKASTVQENIRRMTERILEPVFQRRYGKSYSEQKAAGGLQEYRLQPMLKVHLYSAHMDEKGNILYIYLFIGIGLVLVAIACFNYINLATARSIWEARSTGVRKALGATTGQIHRLFMTDALGMTCISFIVAIGIAQMVLMSDSLFITQFIPHKVIPLHSI